MNPFELPVAERGDRHRLDERETGPVHQHPVLERPGLRFVGVADEVVRLRRLLRDPPPTSRPSEKPRRRGPEQARLEATSFSTGLRPSSRARRSDSKPPAWMYASIDSGSTPGRDAAQEPQAGLARLRQRRPGRGDLLLDRLLACDVR